MPPKSTLGFKIASYDSKRSSSPKLRSSSPAKVENASPTRGRSPNASPSKTTKQKSPSPVKQRRRVRANIVKELNSEAASFAGDVMDARRSKPRGSRSPSPIKVKITRSAFAKIEAKKRQNAAAGVEEGAKL
jgi:hypothetical protein